MSTIDEAMNYLADKVPGIGTTQFKTLSSGVSLSAGSAKALLSVTLTPGTWVLCGSARATLNSAGYMIVLISTTSASISTGSVSESAYSQIYATSGYHCQNVSRIVKINSNTTYYLNIQLQQAGSAPVSQSFLQAVRIA